MQFTFLVLSLCILVGLANAEPFLYTHFADQMDSAFLNRNNAFTLSSYYTPNSIIIGYGDVNDNLVLQYYSGEPINFPPQAVDPPTPFYTGLKLPTGAGSVVGTMFLNRYAFIVSGVQGGMTALFCFYNVTSTKMEAVGFKVFNWTQTEFQSGTPINSTQSGYFLSAIVMNDFTADLRVAVLVRFSTIYKVIVFDLNGTGLAINTVIEVPNAAGVPDIMPFPSGSPNIQSFMVATPYQISANNWGVMTYRTDDQYRLMNPYSIDSVGSKTAFKLKLTQVSEGQFWMVTAMIMTDEGLILGQLIKDEDTKNTLYSQKLADLSSTTFTPFSVHALFSGYALTVWTDSNNSNIYGTAVRYGEEFNQLNFTIPSASPNTAIDDLVLSPLENTTFALTQVVRDETAPSGFINYYALSDCNDTVTTPNENCEGGQTGCVRCMCDEDRGWYAYDGIICITKCEDGIIAGNETCYDGNDSNCKGCQCAEGYAIDSNSTLCAATAVEGGPTNPGGFNMVYVAAIVLCPVGAGAIIFLAVFFGKKQQKKKQQKQKKGDAEEGTPKDNIPLTPVTGAYTTVPSVEAEVRTNDHKYGAISGTSLAGTGTNKSVDKMNVPYTDLKFVKEIGSGAYGKVFIGEWQRTKVALKINTLASGDEFAREAKLMVDLRPHPNVVQMLGVSSDGPYPVMILEFCDGGSLDTKLFQESQVSSVDEQLAMISGIAKGLYHLHRNQIIHRDLAARNILLNFNQPKISDFGLSRLVNDTQKGTTRSNVGPIRWMSPESLKSQTYSTKSDVWSFGMVVYEIVAHREPHADADQMAVGLQIRDNGITPQIPDNCDPALADLMRKCWQLDPEQRPTMEEICDIVDHYTQRKN